MDADATSDQPPMIPFQLVAAEQSWVLGKRDGNSPTIDQIDGQFVIRHF
ncbi:MAG: hypothetical protein ABIP94_23765 [Planctomycetota bacterium]